MNVPDIIAIRINSKKQRLEKHTGVLADAIKNRIMALEDAESIIADASYPEAAVCEMADEYNDSVKIFHVMRKRGRSRDAIIERCYALEMRKVIEIIEWAYELNCASLDTI